MDNVAGWLFLNLEQTRLVFVADGLHVEERFDWDILIECKCLDEFIQRFEAKPTSEGALQGYRIDASANDIKHWLGKAKERGVVAGSDERKKRDDNCEASQMEA